LYVCDGLIEELKESADISVRRTLKSNAMICLVLQGLVVLYFTTWCSIKNSYFAHRVLLCCIWFSQQPTVLSYAAL